MSNRPIPIAAAAGTALLLLALTAWLLAAAPAVAEQEPGPQQDAEPADAEAPAPPPARLGPTHGVEIFRTMMPDAGPSAFAIRFPDAGLALCYDAVRGGIGYLWHGDFDLSPTVAGKINDPAEIDGEPFYRETIVHPLRTTPPGEQDAATSYRFRGYSIRDGALTFRYSVDGVAVTETISPSDHGGIRREFTVEPTARPLYLLTEPQDDADLTFEGGRVEDDYVVFEGDPLRTFVITITPTPAEEDA